ncbi:hypothetical protein SDC9_177297 [bioreactor metagenome]|uniref:Uncharacterized protein n=1 Tax=bioreactor metagenome TaxID=1076179 RepID=A0A645H0K3_9ZZZZ
MDLRRARRKPERGGIAGRTPARQLLLQPDDEIHGLGRRHVRVRQTGEESHGAAEHHGGKSGSRRREDHVGHGLEPGGILPLQGGRQAVLRLFRRQHPPPFGGEIPPRPRGARRVRRAARAGEGRRQDDGQLHFDPTPQDRPAHSVPRTGLGLPLYRRDAAQTQLRAGRQQLLVDGVRRHDGHNRRRRRDPGRTL